jgi:hypothetical protein
MFSCGKCCNMAYQLEEGPRVSLVPMRSGNGSDLFAKCKFAGEIWYDTFKRLSVSMPISGDHLYSNSGING